MSIQKKSSIRYALITVFAILALYFCAVCRADAAEYHFSLNNAWVDGSIAEAKGADFYKFTIPSAGFVHIDYQGWDIYDSYFEVLDESWATNFGKKNVYYTYSDNPKTGSMDFAFEAGVYYVKIYASGSHTGAYRLRGTFTSANNTEREPNDGFAGAMSLAANNRMLGFLSQTDRTDFYKIYVPYDQKIKVTFTSMMNDSYYSIWNADFIQQKKINVYYCSENTPKTSTYEETLKQGTYYIKIEPVSSTTGRYYLSWSQEGAAAQPGGSAQPGSSAQPGGSAKPGSSTQPGGNSGNTQTGNSKTLVSKIRISGNRQITVGKSLTLKASVQPSNAANRAVTWTSGNPRVASVSAKGVVKARKAGIATITASAKDGSGKRASVTVIVVPKKMSAPKLKLAGGKKLQLTWKKQTGASGYQIQYSTARNMRGAKKKTVGNVGKTTLSGLKAGKTYYVKICAYSKNGSKKYAGAWSAAAKIKVK